MLQIIMVPEVDTEVKPAGVKGLAELGNVGTAAAVSNAVFHATGKRVCDLPIRLEKLLLAGRVWGRHLLLTPNTELHPICPADDGPLAFGPRSGSDTSMQSRSFSYAWKASSPISPVSRIAGNALREVCRA